MRLECPQQVSSFPSRVRTSAAIGSAVSVVSFDPKPVCAVMLYYNKVILANHILLKEMK